MSMEFIIIGNEGESGEINYWNNESGWSDFKESATRFTKKEMHTSHLPVGKNVRWMRA